jgi:hypothetical protein
MLVVLVDPPLAAQAEQEVAKNEGKPVVVPGGVESELPVPEVVAEQADLDEDEGEVNGVQELEPRLFRTSSRVRLTASRPMVRALFPA